mmetsp:Transcript_20999/g.59587  ORF Transcript_20999/g.59587 Transcript_20999/m.59587 type:complete len:230 (-) Transcript_20999:1267-1956(-)
MPELFRWILGRFAALQNAPSHCDKLGLAKEVRPNSFQMDGYSRFPIIICMNSSNEILRSSLPSSAENISSALWSTPPSSPRARANSGLLLATGNPFCLDFSKTSSIIGVSKRSCNSRLEIFPLPSRSMDRNASQQRAVQDDIFASAAAAKKSLYDIFPSPSVSMRLTKAVTFDFELTSAATSASSTSFSPGASRSSCKVDAKASIMSCLGTSPSPSLSIISNCLVSSAN